MRHWTIDCVGAFPIPVSGKILSCCYCGTRAAFAPGRERGLSALTCGSCGAPLAVQKQRPVAVKPVPVAAKSRPARPAPPDWQGRKRKPKPEKRRKPSKRRKSILRRLFEEAEDMFDDIFD